jgi:1,4-alpha-glucan branching enzyme
MPPFDHERFRQGTHSQLHDWLGAHVIPEGGVEFAVWAPSARSVSVCGEFDNWDALGQPLSPRLDGSGIWLGRVAAARRGQCYRYRIVGHDHARLARGDPFAYAWEEPPATAPRIWTLEHDWHDDEWMALRHRHQASDAARSIYEVHLGSWQRPVDGGLLSYRELAERLAHHVTRLGFTHVELLPITEHPFYGSWGYQCTGYFAPTARHGTPQDFMTLIDTLHQHGIGVILDWVPGHFPDDEHGLARFDGTHLYDHADARQGLHPDWGTRIFNYDRPEVRSFLLSSARFWLDRYHIDGLRVDAVASMLYLDYSRPAGGWVPNAAGGRENLAAIECLRELNRSIAAAFPDVQTIAEESTAWPAVSRPVEAGGLGFGYKWNMGWMNDTLRHFERDPVHRAYHQDEITFGLWYAWSERFVLPLSHDEVVHGKGSLLTRMPGDRWQQFATLRLLYGLMWAHPGHKLLFMGNEFAQIGEWSHDRALDWDLLGDAAHAGVMKWVADLNRLYRAEPALHADAFTSHGFRWVLADDPGQGVMAFLRLGGGRQMLIVCNLSPVTRLAFRIGVPVAGIWQERLNGDALCYGGSGVGNLGCVASSAWPAHGQPQSLSLTIPPLATLYFSAPEDRRDRVRGEGDPL